MTPGIEVELKYAIRDAGAAERLAAARTLGAFRASGRARQVQIEDRYLDTADGALARAGYAVRLRRGPRMTVVSVKAASKAAEALHRREELEGPAAATLDPHGWPGSAARSLVLEHAGDAPLIEIVTIRQLRRYRMFSDDTAEVEVAVDEVEVVAAGRVADRFLELEAELKRGDEAALVALGVVLGTDPDLSAVRGSKLERALEAIGRGPRGARRPRTSAARSTPPALEPLATDAGSLDVPMTAPEPAYAAAAQRSAKPEQPTAATGRAPNRAAPDPAPVEPQAAESPTAESPAGPAPEPPAAEPAPAEPAPDEAGGPAPEGPAEATRASEPPGSASDSLAGTDVPAVPEPAPVVAGKTPGVVAGDPLAEAGRKVLRFHFARMVAREAGTRSGKDAEDLHSMRVATRRMRAAWRVFGEGFRPKRTRRLRTRLRIVAGRLGAVRDLDVLIEGIEAYRKTIPAFEAAGLAPLVGEWRSRRTAARALLVQELDSPAHQSLVDEYRLFVAQSGMAAAAAASPVVPHRVRDTAGSRIWRAYEEVRAYEAVLRWADVETLHQLRIAAKWLRYTIEFFRETLGPGVETVIPRVVALQDHLGLLHDADVTIALTRQFLVARGGSLEPAQAAAIGAYLRSREKELDRLRRTVGIPWRGVSGPVFRRQLGRAVSGL